MLRLFRQIVLSVSCVALPLAAHADDSLQLVDGTKLVGKLVHYFDGVLTVELPNGTRMKLPAEKVMRLSFQLPKPRAELSTPKKSFERLRKAALNGDLSTYIDCHSAYYQMFLQHQTEQMGPPKFRKRLKEEWGSVQMEILNSTVDKGTAIMKFRGRKGTESQEGEVRFIKENDEWKMILPL